MGWTTVEARPDWTAKGYALDALGGARANVKAIEERGHWPSRRRRSEVFIAFDDQNGGGVVALVVLVRPETRGVSVKIMSECEGPIHDYPVPDSVWNALTPGLDAGGFSSRWRDRQVEQRAELRRVRPL